MKYLLLLIATGLFLGCAHQSMETAGIRATIRSHLPYYKSCYNDALKRNKDAKGRIAIKFHIIENGKVDNASVVKSDLNDPEVDKCVIRAIENSIFPAPPKDQIAEVVYPFDFSAVESGSDKIPQFKSDKVEVTKKSENSEGK